MRSSFSEQISLEYHRYIEKFSYQIYPRVYEEDVVKIVKIITSSWTLITLQATEVTSRMHVCLAHISHSANHLRSANFKGPLWNCCLATLPKDDNEITSAVIIKEILAGYASVNYRLCSSVPFISFRFDRAVKCFVWLAVQVPRWWSWNVDKGWWRFPALLPRYSRIYYLPSLSANLPSSAFFHIHRTVIILKIMPADIN